MKQYDVITSGYVSMDHIIRINRPAAVGYTSLIENKTNSKIYYGGCSVNIAYALCRLGLLAMPVIRVGDDYEQTGFRNFLREGGVPEEGVSVVEGENTSCCYLIEDNEGQHITLFYPGAMDGRYAAPLPDEFFASARLGVITVASHADNRLFFDGCIRHGVPVVFGMKADSTAFPEPFLKELLLGSEIIFTNAEERRYIEGLLGLETIAGLLTVGKAKVIITTYGKQGSSYTRLLDDGGIETRCIPVCDCTCVEDTTGSGDGYMAGFLYAYLRGLPMADCCRMGSTLSSFIIEKEGCCTNAPDADALCERYKSFLQCCSIETEENETT